MQQSEAIHLADAGCFHCGLPIAGDADYHSQLDGKQRDFCCFACQSVCEAIYDTGLQGYYQRTPQGVLLAPPPAPPERHRDVRPGRSAAGLRQPQR